MLAARYGRRSVPGVLRPLADRLVDLLAPAAGESCLDMPCDGGVLSTALMRAVGPDGRVDAVDADPGARRDCTEAAALLRLGRLRVAAHPPTRSYDVVASLLALPHAADPARVLRALGSARVRATGRLGVAVWGLSERVPHEAAVAAALAGCRRPAPFIDAALSLGAPEALRSLAAAAGVEGGEERGVRDVVRFSGVDELWAALVDDRPGVARAAAGLEPGALARARELVRVRLREHTARDGTLVVPVEVAILVAGPRGSDVEGRDEARRG